MDIDPRPAIPGSEAPDLHYLRLFLAVARAGTFSAAAEVLHTSQPALSRQIAALERACGEQLFERLPRGVRLTPAGEVALRYAERIFALADELATALEDLRGLRAGRLQLGASTTPADYLLPPVLAAYRQLYPGVALRLVTGNTAQIAEQIDRHLLDLGIIGLPPAHQERGLEATPLVEDQLVVIAAPAHPLAVKGRSGPAPLSALAAATLVTREAGSATRATAEQCAETLGLRLEPALELGSNEAVKRAVMSGAGIAILSRYAVTLEVAAGHLTLVPVQGWDCRRHFFLVRRATRRPTRAEQAFLTLLTAHPLGEGPEGGDCRSGRPPSPML